MERESFICYSSFVHAGDRLPDCDRLLYYDRFLRYAIDWDDRPVEGIAETMFILIKPQIDANNKRFVNWQEWASYWVKWWRPKTEFKTNKTNNNPTGVSNNNPIGTKSKTPNVNVNVNVNDNEKETEDKKELENFVNSWNSIENILDKKWLPKTIKITDDLKAIWKKRKKEYSLDEIKTAARNYCKEIEWRVDDGKWYITHRFTLFEFLQQKNWLQKFFNS